MKRLTLISLVFCFTMLCITSIAETKNTTLTFRGIPWYSSVTDTYDALAQIDGINISKSSINTEYRIDDWCHGAVSMYSEISITNGGTSISADNVNVAGHDAKLCCEFMYPIQNERINRDSNSAQLFKAEYLIWNDNLSDTYIDLRTKLINLYGEPTTVEKTAGFKQYYDVEIKGDSFWKAEDGSIIWLALYYDSYKETYDAIMLTYAAPNSTARLIELESQIEYEKNIPLDEPHSLTDTNFDGL